MLRYLITGADGQLGRQLQQQLHGRGHIHATNRQQLDISDATAVHTAIHTLRPDIIINTAAYTAVDAAEQQPQAAHAINATGAANLARAAHASGGLLLHLSTDYVFNGQQTTPYRETDPTDPQTAYGQSKQAGEIAIRHHCPRHIIVRTAWLFGEHGHNFVKTILRRAAQGQPLHIVADQIGSPTYTGDLAAALIQIAEQAHIQARFGTYHFAGQPHVSWYDFAHAILTQAQQQNLLPHPPALYPISSQAYPSTAPRPAYSSLDCHKIQTDFGIAPSNWQQALTQLQRFMAD